MHSVSRDARANWGSLRAVRCQKMHASTLYLDGWTIASPNPQVHAKHSSFWALVVYLVILVLSCTRVNQLSQGLWTEPLLRSSLPGPRPFDLAMGKLPFVHWTYGNINEQQTHQNIQGQTYFVLLLTCTQSIFSCLPKGKQPILIYLPTLAKAGVQECSLGHWHYERRTKHPYYTSWSWSMW